MSLGFGGSNSSSNQQQTSNTFANGSGSYSNNPVTQPQIMHGIGVSQGIVDSNIPAALATAGMRGVNDAAQTGNAAYSAASPELAKTLGGDYLSAGNPAFQQMADRVGAATRSTIDSGFEGAGRYGSPLAARAQAQGVGDAIGALGYQNYAQERGNQMTALGAVPGFAAGATAPGAAQLSAGMAPIQQLLAALQLNAGQSGTYQQSQNNNGTTTGSGSGSTSTFNIGI